MKRNLVFALGAVLLLLRLQADQVTIYNDNFALIRTSLQLELVKGVQNIFIDDIPATIEAHSVIIKPRSGEIEIFSQNFEYDLANTNQILRKYIGKEVEVITKTDQVFTGILQFNDHQTIGILDGNTNKLTLLQYSEVRNINLAELPDNFFLKPTLNWRLQSKKAGKHDLDFTYLCFGMNWNVTYNCVWNADKEKLDINSWVTIVNETGKAFHDTKLKLMAGDVSKTRQGYDEMRSMAKFVSSGSVLEAAPEFAEKAFHDFHLYTLSENVSINNKQTKQLQLFPLKTVDAVQNYRYYTYSNDVTGYIEFVNSRKYGLGLPLPKGEVKIYQTDKADDQLEFIGEDRIDHTPAEETVKITTGNVFDLVAETKILDSRKISRTITEKDYEVTLKNRTKMAKEIIVIHRIGFNWTISNNSADYKKKDASTIEFIKQVKAGEEMKITWTERIEN